MFNKLLVIGAVLAAAVSIANAADTAPAKANLSVTDIVTRNIAARGGLQGWRAVQTLSWSGKMGVGGNQRQPIPVALEGKGGHSALPVPPRPKDETLLPFRMEMQRPRKVRFELDFKGQTAIQVYDGMNGWKLRPYLNRMEVEPFNDEELNKSAMQADIDGPLVDYVAKGTHIDLDGVEKVDNRDNYKLKLTLKNGKSLHLWIDAQTFLETKIEGNPRRLDGVEHPVEVVYSDYRAVNGLQIPFVLETRVLPLPNPPKGARQTSYPPEKIAIEKVEVNPHFDASLFTKPEVQTAKNPAPPAGAAKVPVSSPR